MERHIRLAAEQPNKGKESPGKSSDWKMLGYYGLQIPQSLILLAANREAGSRFRRVADILS